MIATVKKIEGGLAVILTEDDVRELGLEIGSPVEVLPVSSNGNGASPKDHEAPSEVCYMSAEKALEVYNRTLPRFEKAYRELAK